MSRLVLLHGFSDSARCWDPWRGFFQRFGGLLTPDARGHGGRPLPAGPFGTAQHLEDLLPLLEGPSILVGHSMGAATAALVAARHPELVEALVLEDPPWRSSDEEPASYGDWITEMRSMTLEQRAELCRAENPTWSEDEIGPWAESKGQVDPAIVDREIEWLAEPWKTTAATIACPALLLVADPALGGIVNPSDAGWIAANTGIRVVTIEGAGHSIRRDQPGRYAQAIEAFFAGE